MSRKSNEQSIKEVIDNFLKTYRMDEKMDEVSLKKVWLELMGPAIEKRTTRLQLRNKVLVIYLNSASLRQELHLAREKITALINEKIGRDVVQVVELR